MAEIVSEIILKANSNEAVRSIKDLRNNVREYKDQLTQLERGTEEYNDVLNKLAQSQGELNQINSETQAATQNLTQIYGNISRVSAGVISGFTALTSISALLGKENDKLAESLIKIQAGLQLTQSLYAVSNGFNSLSKLIIGFPQILNKVTTAFRVFNATVAANPVLAIVTAIIALTAAVVIFTNRTKDNTEAIEANTRASNAYKESLNNLEIQQDRSIRLAEAQGKSEEELLALRKANVVQLLALARAEYAREEASSDVSEAALERLRNLGEEIYRLQKLSEDLSYEEFLLSVRRSTKAADDAAKAAISRREEELRLQAEYNAKLERLELERIARIEAIESKRRQDFLDTLYEFNEDVNNFFNELEEPDIPFVDKLIDFSNHDAVEARLAELRYEAEQLKEIFTEEGLGTAEGVAAWEKYISTVKQVRKIEGDYSAYLEDETEKRKKIQQVQLRATAEFLAASATLIGENTVAGKALAVAGATINTYLAGTLALATYPPPASYLALAATIATGLATVKNILSTNIPGTSDSISGLVSTPSLPSFPEMDTNFYEVHNTMDGYEVDELNQQRTVLVLEDFNQVNNRVRVAEDSATF